MKNQSITIVGIVIAVLALVLDKLGANISSEAISTTVYTIVEIVALIIAYYGRVRKGDINLFGRRK